MRKPSKTSSAPAISLPADAPPGLADALRILGEARERAQQDQLDVWATAIALPVLLQAGLTKKQLSGLWTGGAIEQRDETTRPGDRSRTFRPSPSGRISKRTCFVLTAAASPTFSPLLAAAPAKAPIPQPQEAAPSPRSRTNPIPHWNRRTLTLTFRGKVVKRFKRYPRNQAPVLDYLEKSGWRQVVENILEALSGPHRMTHLHNTINWLNRGQQTPLIRFHPYGKTGIRWEDVSHKSRVN